MLAKTRTPTVAKGPLPGKFRPMWGSDGGSASDALPGHYLPRRGRRQPRYAARACARCRLASRAPLRVPVTLTNMAILTPPTYATLLGYSEAATGFPVTVVYRRYTPSACLPGLVCTGAPSMLPARSRSPSERAC